MSAVFAAKRKHYRDLSERFNWRYIGNDAATGRVSFSDEMGVYRVEIYTTKMTVGFTPKGAPTQWMKNATEAQLMSLFKNPYEHLL